MRYECTARRDVATPALDDAREAIVETYYELADAYVQTPRPDAADDRARGLAARRMKRVAALEDSLRDAARVLAEAHGDGDTRQDWLPTFMARLDALREVRATGLTEAHARTLYQLKQSIDQVIAE